MPARTAPRRMLVDPVNFLVATRDSGYKTTALAVAELVDNSIQAGASVISVDVIPTTDADFPVELRVTDNGSGMDTVTLGRALMFGGSSRFGDRGSLGRYGMGLPNGALSRARRVEVYSRQGPTAHWCYLDVDEIVRTRQRTLPAVSTVENFDLLPDSPSGTVVRLLRCDRLEYRRASVLAQRLVTELGRVYRLFLLNDLRLLVNGTQVVPIDPLFLDPASRASGARPFGDVLRYRLEVDGTAGSIEVRFTELPIESWQVMSSTDKRRSGITEAPSVSVLRADREIDRGWFFMGAKRRENYDDWWRCEVRFEPALDEMFGITHAKQAIAPTRKLLDVLTPDLEPIARALNSRVRKRFELVKVTTPLTAAERQAARAHPQLPPLPRRVEHPIPSCEEWAMQLDSAAADNRPYQLVVSELPSTAAFEVALRRGRLVVALNSRHPLYRDLYGPLAASETQNDQDAATRLALTVLAAARAEYGGRGKREVVRQFRQTWSDVLATFLNA